MQIEKSIIAPNVTIGISRLQNAPYNDWELDPDDLRDQVQRSLSALCQIDRERFCWRLLRGLAKAGVPVGSSLFLLGIPAVSLDDLTPSDIGKLLRYVRLITPAAIQALAEPLAELLAIIEEPARPARTIEAKKPGQLTSAVGRNQDEAVPPTTQLLLQSLL